MAITWARTASMGLFLGAALLFSTACKGQPVPPAPTTPGHTYPNEVQFRFDVGDELEVDVWREAELKTVQRILPDGTISPPLLDPVSVSGKSISEVRKDLAEKYGEYLRDPVVSVKVSAIHSQRIFVLGEVKSPTVLPLHGPTTVLQAIAMAGGFNEEVASKGTVRIVRPTPTGCPQVFSIDTCSVMMGTRTSAELAAGDIIYVHPTGIACWSRGLQQAFAPVGALLGPLGSAAASFVALDTIVND